MGKRGTVVVPPWLRGRCGGSGGALLLDEEHHDRSLPRLVVKAAAEYGPTTNRIQSVTRVTVITRAAVYRG